MNKEIDIFCWSAKKIEVFHGNIEKIEDFL